MSWMFVNNKQLNKQLWKQHLQTSLLSIYAIMHECSGNIFQEALETEKAEGTSTATIMIVNPLPFFFIYKYYSQMINSLNKLLLF